MRILNLGVSRDGDLYMHLCRVNRYILYGRREIVYARSCSVMTKEAISWLLMSYKEGSSRYIWVFWRVKSTKLCLKSSGTSHPSLSFFILVEGQNILKGNKVDATMADHLFARGPTHSRKTQDHHLMQLGGVVLPRAEYFVTTWSRKVFVSGGY